MYYQRRKCSQNVYFLERSKERSSQPVLKDLPLDCIKVWNTSIDKAYDDKNCGINSMAALKISAVANVDWRRDRTQGSCEELSTSRGLQLVRRHNLKQLPNSQENIENQQPPTAGSSISLLPEQPLTPASKTLSLEEQNQRLRESLTAVSEESRGLRNEMARSNGRMKQLEEELSQKNKQIDLLERERWLANYRVAELQASHKAMQEACQNRVDPVQLHQLMKKIEMLEMLQRQMERQIREDGDQWERDKLQYEEGVKKLR